ncbi:MAG: HDOD domain-containing protein [Burkholderiales bacterium]
MEAALLSPEQDAEAIVRDLGIPPCPEILLKVLREMRQDDPDFAKIGNLISSDVSLAAATLETVNAAAFGLRTKVASVDKALSLLGLRNVKDVVTGLLLREALPIDDSAALDHFWDTSSAVAQTAALIARPLAKLDREDAYTFALFRDCGIPLMVRKFSDYDRFFTTAVSGARSFTAAERSHFSVDHACVGAHLARKWQLPDEMADAIALHHEYDVLSAGNTPDSTCRLVALALAAEHIHARCTTGKDSIEWMKGGDFALEILGASSTDIDEHADMVDGILNL